MEEGARVEQGRTVSLGMSGAEIVVSKRGPGCLDQGLYCAQLGPAVAPHVLALHKKHPHGEEGYDMEILAPFTLFDRRFNDVLHAMASLLADQVWCHPWGGAVAWHGELDAWLNVRAPWLLHAFCALYDTQPMPGEYCKIHGDPTVANLMIRPTTAQLIITDPLRPRGKIPPLREVDIGKLLQSAVGWERVLSGARGPNLGDINTYHDIESWLHCFGADCVRKSWFWCAVHLARTVSYCRAKGAHHIATWAISTSQLLTQRLDDNL